MTPIWGELASEANGLVLVREKLDNSERSRRKRFIFVRPGLAGAGRSPMASGRRMCRWLCRSGITCPVLRLGLDAVDKKDVTNGF